MKHFAQVLKRKMEVKKWFLAITLPKISETLSILQVEKLNFFFVNKKAWIKIFSNNNFSSQFFCHFFFSKKEKKIPLKVFFSVSGN